MDIGKLNCRVTVEKPLPGRDSAGQPVEGWVTHTVLWANIRTLRGAELIKRDRVTATVQASIRCRYRKDITPDMRVVYGNDTWFINAVLPDETHRTFMELVAERRV